MSEYQYYEFQAIDRPLTQTEKAAISQLSSRVNPTATRASFTYSYGDFPGDPKKVLTQYFDIMYYIANWGTQQLMFRFPKSLIDQKVIAPYCVAQAWRRQIQFCFLRLIPMLDILMCVSLVKTISSS